MRIGVMLGPERGRYGTKVERLVLDAKLAEASGFSSVWIPQIPDDFDALTAATLVGTVTSRIEIGTAVVPIQSRHPIAMAQQALSTQAVCNGRLALGLGVSHHWVVTEMLGLPYEHLAPHLRDYLEVLAASFDGPALVEVDNDRYHVRNPLDITDIAQPVLIAALGPAMLRLAGERTDGTILWLADERAIGSHVAPRINAAAEAAGRPTPRIVAGVPVCLCADDEVDDRHRPGQQAPVRGRGVAELPEAPRAGRRPRDRRPHGRGQRGEHREAAPVVRRRRHHRRLAARRPIGKDREERLASSHRTREFLASLQGSLAT